MKDKKQEKFLKLYEPIHDRFERFCRARVFGQMDFRDLMNDTLLIAFQKFETLQSEKAFLSFLFGICIRVISNQQKKKKEIYNLEDNLHTPSQSTSAEVQADVFLLHRALAKLPDHQRESIILFEITGFSIREIAKLHGVSASAVKKRLERGRKKLTELLVESPLSVDSKS